MLKSLPCACSREIWQRPNCPKPHNPRPHTLNPKPHTLNPKPLNPQPQKPAPQMLVHSPQSEEERGATLTTVLTFLPKL